MQYLVVVMQKYRHVLQLILVIVTAPIAHSATATGTTTFS